MNCVHPVSQSENAIQIVIIMMTIIINILCAPHPHIAWTRWIDRYLIFNAQSTTEIIIIQVKHQVRSKAYSTNNNNDNTNTD